MVSGEVCGVVGHALPTWAPVPVCRTPLRHHVGSALLFGVRDAWSLGPLVPLLLPPALGTPGALLGGRPGDECPVWTWPISGAETWAGGHSYICISSSNTTPTAMPMAAYASTVTIASERVILMAIEHILRNVDYSAMG
jgi:hypothetical protein